MNANTMTATARPWRVDVAPLSKTTCIFGGDDFNTWICGKFSNEQGAEIYGAANAALIVRAVNRDHLFDALVSALENLCLCQEGAPMTGIQATAYLEAARSILSQVKGE